MWLRDALPKDVSGLRVLTYGFESGLVGSTSFASIGSYAKELLRDLIGARSHVDVSIVASSFSLRRVISRSQSPYGLLICDIYYVGDAAPTCLYLSQSRWSGC
jgi:hypothetical protein